MIKIPEQKQVVFVGSPYEISVEKVNKNTFRYHLINDDVPIVRHTQKDEPINLNRTSQFVKDCIKQIHGLTTETTEGIIFEYTKAQIGDQVMKTLSFLQDKLDAYISNKAENDKIQKKQRMAEQEEHLYQRSQEFCDFLYDHDITLIDFLYYAAEWLSGGEVKNILKGMICHLSTCFKLKPIWFMPLGKAGEGKTVIDEAAQKLIPSEVFLNGRISESALHRKASVEGNDYVDGKVMLMRDMGGKLDLEKWKDTIDRYKELTTDGVTEIEKVGEGLDEETGERKVISFKLFGFCSVSITSVNSESFDGQILSRGINVSPEATDQQVKMYHKYNNGLIKTKQTRIIEDEIGLLHDYIRYIMLVHAPHVKVFNPYWECLESWFHESEYYKRNLALYSSLVEAVTLLNYEFRSKQTASDGQEYVISSREDNELVSDLFNVSQGLTSNATHIFNLMVGWFRPADTLETNFNEEIEEEYFNYQHNNLNLKECKYIFSVSNVKNNASKVKKLRNLPYGDILNSLINNGLVQVVGKMNRGNNNIYALDHWEPIDETKIVFDEDCISEYVDSMCVPYGLDPTSLWKIVNGEKSYNDVEHSFKDLEFPPWVSPVSSKYRRGTTKYRK